MEPWGAALFGDPCRECGFDWSLPPADAIDLVRYAPNRFAQASSGTDGSRRLAGQTAVNGYDPDALAAARGYPSIPVDVALWSLRASATAWVDVLDAALREGVVLDHATRGAQRAEDIARNNAHDASHHLWDVQRILEG